jgi:transposase-like protein
MPESSIRSTFPVLIHNLLDINKCYEFIRQLRWKDGVRCLHCTSNKVKKNGRHGNDPHCQRYRCCKCGFRFNDLSRTVLSGRHQSLTVWVTAIYFMGLNLSNAQIAQELDLNNSDLHEMATTIRETVCDKKTTPVLRGEVECDEAYVVAGHKGNPQAVQRENRPGRRRRLRGARGRGTLDKGKPPILGIIERKGEVAIFMLPNVQMKTIEPVLRASIQSGALVYTDEYAIYGQLCDWGYAHKTVCHATGEYARDEDGDGFHEVHVNTIEGFWSLLRSWLRPHRGISQEKLPLYLGFFEFVHNIRRRGKALLPSLIELLVAG